MGLFADIPAQFNFTKADLKNVYLRINSVNVYPKYGIIKILLAGYITKDSGQLLREDEYELVRQVDTVYQTTALTFTDDQQITAGYLVNRDQILPPPQSPMEPLSVFRDVYTMKLSDANATAMTVEALYPILYEALKADGRLQNVRDDV